MAGGYCSTCRQNVGRNHLSTATHRAKVARAEIIPDALAADESARLRLEAQRRRGPVATDAENDAAMRRLEGEPPLWVDEAPAPEPWMDPEYRDPSPAIRGVTLAPCPRCGRRDFRTDKGRSWHLANVPSCRSYMRPERHEYATIPA